MNRMTVISQVGADGVLNVSVPVGVGDANLPVQVTIEPAESNSNGAAGDYATWLDSLSGQWQGDFVRGDEGPLETREPIS
jgi:hypothetical protein